MTRFTSPKSVNNKVVLPLFLVHITANSKANLLTQIRAVNHQLVKWEKLKKGGILQCKNCQRFGHAAANCNMGYRCVKCDQSHSPGKCSITDSNIDKSKIFCVSCNAFGHPASYRGCPNHKKLIVQMRVKVQAQIEQKQLKQRMVDNYIKPKVSFANLFQQTTQQVNQNSNLPIVSPQTNNLEQMLTSMRDSILLSMKNQFDIFSKMLNEQKIRIDALYDALDLETVNYNG